MKGDFMRKILLAGATIAVAAAVPAIAESVQPHHGGMMNKTETRTEVQGDVAKMFGHLDANKDGFVTDAEIQAVQAKHMEKREAKMEQRAEHFDPAKMFARLDTNKDGKVTKAEADAVRASHAQAKGKAPHGADHLFARVDTNKDGAITLAEMQAMPRPKFDPAAMHKGGGMRGHLFSQADLNKDGKVTLAEAQTMALQHFDRADANRDGKVTPEERKALRKSMHAPQKG